MSLRVGIMWPQGAGAWTAGTIYVENLVRSVLLARRSDVEIVLIEPEGGEYSKRGNPLAGSEYADFAVPVGRSIVAGLDARRRRVRGLPPKELGRLIEDREIQVVFGNFDWDAGKSFPWVGWIPDFQHVKYPEFFPHAEVVARDVTYRKWAADCSLMMLSSHAAERDFREFAPTNSRKARVASFASLLPDEYFEVDASSVAARFHVSRPYVVVPNQWWQHKNHETVIRAARALHKRGSDITWVFTGGLQDHRDTTYPSRMLQLIAELELTGCVRVLGVLDRLDQVQLLRDADLIVHASLFEGWSTVVEDARALGQRIVLSDLEVHREQDPPHAVYFDPVSVDALADAIERTIADDAPRTTEAAASAEASRRALSFGNTFLDICSEAAAR